MKSSSATAQLASLLSYKTACSRKSLADGKVALARIALERQATMEG